jgi:3-keto-disaccharide hydrolase
MVKALAGGATPCKGGRMGVAGGWAQPAIGAEFLFRVIVGAATLSTIGCSSGSSSQPSVSADGAVAAGGSGQDAPSGNSASGSSGGTTSSSGSSDASSQGTDAAGADSGGLGAAGADASSGSDSAGAQEAGAGTTGSGNDGGGSATTDGGSDATAPGDDGGGSDGGGWVDLFDGVDFTGFNANCNMAHTTSPPTITGAAAMAYFAAENGTIHVYPTQADQSTQPFCLLTTQKSYTHFNLTWEYQWGSKKFASTADPTAGTNFATYPRDAGVLWSLFGDVSQIWPSSIEFQNKWGSTGDIFALYAQCKSLGAPGDSTTYAPASAGGTQMTVNGSTGFVQHHRSANYELTTLPDGGTSANGYGTGWNSCLLEANAGVSTYTVNGHVVNQTLGITDQSGSAVLSGPIGWQAESSEVYYRNLQIQVLP